MSPEDNNLVDEITNFMLSCGGPYVDEYIRPLQETIVWALATNTYIYIPGKAFVCWWLVTEDDIDSLAENVKPVDILSGDICYIVELGLQNYNINRLVAQIRRRMPHAIGVCWFSHKHGQFVFHPTQKGV